MTRRIRKTQPKLTSHLALMPMRFWESDSQDAAGTLVLNPKQYKDMLARKGLSKYIKNESLDERSLKTLDRYRALWVKRFGEYAANEMWAKEHK